MPPQGYGVPPHGGPAGAYGPPPPGNDAPSRPPGPGIGLGVSAGLGLFVLGLALFFATGSLMPSGNGLFGGPTFLVPFWPFVVIPLLTALLYFLPKWRRFATGVLIIFAAMWIVLVGPCIALIASFNTY